MDQAQSVLMNPNFISDSAFRNTWIIGFAGGERYAERDVEAGLRPSEPIGQNRDYAQLPG